jgi:hypothetical protein
MERDPNSIELPPPTPVDERPPGDEVIDNLDEAGDRPIDNVGVPDPSATQTEGMPVDEKDRPVDRDPSA